MVGREADTFDRAADCAIGTGSEVDGGRFLRGCLVSLGEVTGGERPALGRDRSTGGQHVSFVASFCLAGAGACNDRSARMTFFFT